MQLKNLKRTKNPFSLEFASYSFFSSKVWKHYVDWAIYYQNNKQIPAKYIKGRLPLRINKKF